MKNQESQWVETLERKIAERIHIHSNFISAFKLFIITPLLLLNLKQFNYFTSHPWKAAIFFLTFTFLDYIDWILVKYKKLETTFARFFDSLTDYPILIILANFCFEILPQNLLILKLSLDFILILLYTFNKDADESRTRTGINFTVLLALLFLSQGGLTKLINTKLVIYLLWLNIVFSIVIILYNLKILQKRYIADALSAANLLCGIFSMFFASNNKIDISFLFLMIGAVFDGFDGAAARKFGGTRLGVYSDDIADGVNYGIAPGVALYFIIGNIEGMIIGITYSFFTIGRLVYFTLNKKNSDPEYFCGVPSTIGAFITMCSLILFKNHLAILGLMVGIACIQMVSFDTYYKHLGRAIASNRRIIYGMPAIIMFFIIGNLFWSRNILISIILGASLLYGFFPIIIHFKNLLYSR